MPQPDRDPRAERRIAVIARQHLVVGGQVEDHRRRQRKQHRGGVVHPCRRFAPPAPPEEADQCEDGDGADKADIVRDPGDQRRPIILFGPMIGAVAPGIGVEMRPAIVGRGFID